MRGLVALAALLLTLGAGAARATSAAETRLTVTFWADGQTATAKEAWTLRCSPAGGTLNRPGRACQRLARSGRGLFAPLRKGIVCTQIYGGPQVAQVAGILDGRRLWARFSRRNGCEIDRWNRLSPWLLPSGSI
jgi:Subtilisin inhibitor-like